MSIIYGTPPFSAVQLMQVGGIGRSSMPTSVPPASVTCTRGFRRRFADLLPGGGPACSPGTATRPSRTGSNGCLQTVGLLGVPWPAALGVPRTATTRSSRGPARQRLTQARLGIVLLSLSSHPNCRSPPGAEPRRATQTQDPAALGSVQGLGPQAPAQATGAAGRACLGRRAQGGPRLGEERVEDCQDSVQRESHGEAEHPQRDC